MVLDKSFCFLSVFGFSKGLAIEGSYAVKYYNISFSHDLKISCVCMCLRVQMIVRQSICNWKALRSLNQLFFEFELL